MSDSVDAPVVRLVNGILMESLRERATDIHIEPYEDRVVVRYRVDGVLSDRYSLSKGHQAPVTSRIKVMANMDIAERFVPQAGLWTSASARCRRSTASGSSSAFSTRRAACSRSRIWE